MKGTWVTALMIGGALAAGSAAAYFANGYIERSVEVHRAAIDAQYQPVRVIVANADLHAGTSLSNQTVAVREMPRAFLHSSAVPADRWNELAGRVLAHAVRSGEPVLLSHLTHDVAAGFSTHLAPGLRAITFPVDEESSLAGMLSPGDHIDIFFTTTSGSETVTLPLLVNVPIIATGMRTLANAALTSNRMQPAPYRTVTVSVAPEDAARIALALDAGKITVTLRQPEDREPIQVARMSKATLLNGHTVQSKSARRKIEIIIGNM